MPAEGCPIAEHDPIRLVFRLQVCDEHFTALQSDPQSLTTDYVKKLIKAHTVDLAPPDFGRAFISRVNFGDKEWSVLTGFSHS